MQTPRDIKLKKALREGGEMRREEGEGESIRTKWDSAKDGFDFVCKMSRRRRRRRRGLK